jgi:MerR family transcriptional regulator, light-induced transcriptional regulator
MKFEKEYKIFISHLEKEDKEKSVIYALSLLDDEKVGVDDLYKYILAPSLIFFECDVKDEEICIWKEHLRTSIIRTILESAYAYIIKSKDKKSDIDKKVMVLTPAFEYHEIGAIMVSHLMVLQGFDAS